MNRSAILSTSFDNVCFIREIKFSGWCFRDALPSILKKSRHTEIWGIDLKDAEGKVLEVILEKFLKSHSTVPALQVSRAMASLEKALEWRRFSDPRALFAGAESITWHLPVPP
ncbi:hypothetical protein VN97_g3339 [Penicillium thymicola]|uniref:Phosphatidylinositol transfer protein SFH5 n=1 Tax=Penicillium thymicola TaxID=293382 RepID=A0AAI9TN86_PENTH|nr:hypothetical protein VN97_g3339 [Penicillium thymicola]